MVDMKIDSTRPLAVDLFAGAGGLSLDLEQAGYEIAAAVEYDPIHAAVHEFNFPYSKTFARDISTIKGEQIRGESQIGNQEIHLVAGGPPCQGISLIGKRAIDDPRNALMKDFVRLVLELNPRYFLMENVAGLLVGKHQQLLTEIIAELERNGRYRVVKPINVLQAAAYGTPQSRQRVVIMGARSDVPLPTYPQATHQPRTIKGLPPSHTDLPLGPSVSDAISDLPNADLYDELLDSDIAEQVSFSEPSTYAAILRGIIADPDDYAHIRPHNVKALTSSARTVHTQTSIDRFSTVIPGNTERVSRFLRLHPDGISNTLRAGTGSERGAHTAPRPIHPTYARVITVREAARLHGYPDWFRFHATKWNGFRQIGNSVPIPLGRTVGAQLLIADGITPHKGRPIPLGPTKLLYFNSGEAHKYFGLKERVVSQRIRKAS